MPYLRKTIRIIGCIASVLAFLFVCLAFDQTVDIALFTIPWGILIARNVFTMNESFTTIGFFMLAIIGSKYWVFLVRSFRTQAMSGNIALIGFHLVGAVVQLLSGRCYHGHGSLLADCLETLSFGLFLFLLRESVKRRRLD